VKWFNAYNSYILNILVQYYINVNVKTFKQQVHAVQVYMHTLIILVDHISEVVIKHIEYRKL